MKDYLVKMRIESVRLFQRLGVEENWAILLQSITIVLAILIFAWLVDSFATFLMRSLIPKIVGRTKNKWDDIFMENRVFANLAHFLPGLVMLAFYPLIALESFRVFIINIMDTYFIIVALLFCNALINSFSDVYATIKGQRAANIKIYLQVMKVLLFSLGGIAIISIFANKNFIDILKGLGAMVTILLIVYKDTIMGFVAGIQLSANKMLKVGDWISIPKDNADGTVIDISLNTVKVQNWDKTITTIPTYKLMSESFTNWKGMEESDGRRIKRSVNIDMDSIRFLSEEEIQRYKKFRLLENYILEKEEEIRKLNEGVSEYVNQRRLTNVGTFRKYVENYLKQTGFANIEMTFIVRQLQSTEKGLPVEVYMFCKEKEWAKYEQIQSDIFDHIFAMVPEFELRIFQNPSGNSFSRITLTK